MLENEKGTGMLLWKNFGQFILIIHAAALLDFTLATHINREQQQQKQQLEEYQQQLQGICG